MEAWKSSSSTSCSNSSNFRVWWSCSELCPAAFWVSPERRPYHLSGQPVPVLNIPLGRFFYSVHLVSISLAVVCLHCSLSFLLHLWEESGPGFSVTCSSAVWGLHLNPHLAFPFSGWAKPISLSLFSCVMYNLYFTEHNISCLSNTLPKESGSILWRKASQKTF